MEKSTRTLRTLWTQNGAAALFLSVLFCKKIKESNCWRTVFFPLFFSVDIRDTNKNHRWPIMQTSPTHLTRLFNAILKWLPKSPPRFFILLFFSISPHHFSFLNVCSTQSRKDCKIKHSVLHPFLRGMLRETRSNIQV